MNVSTTKTNGFSEKVGLFLNKNAKYIAIAVVACVVLSMLTFATADGMWATLVEFIRKWVRRIGGLAAVFGGIQLGMGFSSNDPSQKLLGGQMLAGAAIVIGVVEVAAAFLV